MLELALFATSVLEEARNSLLLRMSSRDVGRAREGLCVTGLLAEGLCATWLLDAGLCVAW